MTRLHAETIEQVIDIMDGIVAECLDKQSRLGFFVSLYRTTTIVVKERCDAGNFFEDNDRMRKLDAVFANRYFDAYQALMNNEQPGESWGTAFELANDPRLIILQHLLMGMNAHISLDLGIAAVEISDGELTPSLERDFYRLNNLLANLIDTIQDELSIVSPLLKYMDWLGGRFDETFVSYSINYARDRAWKFAQDLINVPPDQRAAAIAERDKIVANFSRNVIANTRFPMSLFTGFVNLRESKDTRTIIEALSNEKWNNNIKQRMYLMMRQVEEKGLDLSKRDSQLIKIPRELLQREIQ